MASDSMTEQIHVAIVAATAATLRQVAGWGVGDDLEKDFYELATALGTWKSDGMCCPMCQEVECDEGCPLEPVRAVTVPKDPDRGVW